MTENIDKIDRRILELLQGQADLSLDAISELVHLSRNACWRRIRRMEDAGVIRKRVTLLDPEALGLPLCVFVLVRTHQHNPDWLARFRQAITAMPEIVGAHRMTGDLDYILRVRIASMRDYDAFYQRLIARVPVSDISASFVMEDLKDTTALPL